MNIGSGNAYPANVLSNFAPHPFIFDGVPVASMEGLLQAFKFDKWPIQQEVCKLVGIGAKRRGSKKNWQRKQILWWNNVPYRRDSKVYRALLNRAYKAMFDQSDSFRRALKSSGNSTLTHTIGRNNSSETVLTSREFCSILSELRFLNL
jgi:hypothetical protein